MGLSTKKVLTSMKTGAHPATARWTDGIEQLTPLGGGYVVIKLDSATAEALERQLGAHSAAGSVPLRPLPQVPERQLRQLIATLDTRIANPAQERRSTVARKRLGVAGHDENQTFMQTLRDQEAANRVRDVDAGVLLTAKELAARLHITPQALSKAVRSNRMFSLPGPSGVLYYPAFYADSRYERKQLEAVSKALGDLPGLSKWSFFTSPKVSLNSKSALDGLAGGGFQSVLRLAAGSGDR